MYARTFTRRTVMLGGVASVASGMVAPRAAAVTRPVIKPESYGAAGNMFHNDSKAFERCVADARRLGADIQLRPVTYLASFDVSGVRILGGGATIKAPGSVEGPLLTASAPFELRNLTLKFTPTILQVLLGLEDQSPDGVKGTAGIAIDVPDSGFAAASRIANVTVRGADHGIRIAGKTDIVNAYYAPNARLTISNTTFLNGGVGIWAVGISGLQVDSVIVEAPRSHGVLIAQSAQSRVTRTNVTSADIHGIVVMYSSDITVTGCEVSGSQRGGIVFGGGSTSKRASVRGTIVNNRCTDNGTCGITVDTTQKGQEGVPVKFDGTVADNVALRNGIHGIVVTCSSLVRLARNTSSSNKGAGIALATRENFVDSNTCNNNGTYGVALFGGPQRPLYGWHRVMSNLTAGNVRAGLYNPFRQTI